VHDAEYYKLKYPEIIPTAVDKNYLCAAFYKNITFLVKIYVMTPQYSTIRRFQLLCVLKDFSEDYSGEYDSGGSDLSVNFSIVGEIDEDMDKSGVAAVMDEDFPKWEKKLTPEEIYKRKRRYDEEYNKPVPVVGGSQYSWK
jgi:hypothetical protein